MTVLHVYDGVLHGGATAAAQSVAMATGAQQLLLPAVRPAISTIGGYCDQLSVRWLRRWIRRANCDVVHLHNFKHVGTAAIKAAKLEGKRVVWSCYDYWCLCPRDTGYSCCSLRPDSSCWRTWQPVNRKSVPPLVKLPLIGRRRRIMRWLNQLDAVICLSRYSEKLLREHGMTAPIHVVPLPVTVAPLRDSGERDPNLVLYLGGQAAHKGWHIWQQIVERLQAERPEVVCKAMHGATRTQALREIARAACLVVPEQWPNPGPMVIAEAQLLGTPVVASGIGGIPAMKPTAMCPANSPELFGQLIWMLLQRRVAGLPAADVDEHRARYDPDRIGAQLWEVYRLVSIRTPHAL